jgi:hypothetical protein
MELAQKIGTLPHVTTVKNNEKISSTEIHYLAPRLLLLLLLLLPTTLLIYKAHRKVISTGEISIIIPFCLNQ